MPYHTRFVVSVYLCPPRRPPVEVREEVLGETEGEAAAKAETVAARIHGFAVEQAIAVRIVPLASAKARTAPIVADDFVRRARAVKGWPLSRIAQVLDVTFTRVYHIERRVCRNAA